MIEIKQKFISLLNLKNNRNKVLARNVGFTTLFQLGSVLISVILLPISLSMLSVEVYGVWLTISSILVWLGYLDLGLGSGLKNKLSIAIAKADYKKAKKLISTAYVTIIMIMSLVALMFFFLSKKINYVNIFGNPSPSVIDPETLFKTINLVVYFFILRFVFQLINPIMEAIQKLFWTKIIFFTSQLMILLVLVSLKYFIEPDIVILGLVFSVSPVVCLIIGSLIFFWENKNLKPSIHDVDFALVRDLYSVGFRFLLIQINMLILFQSSNFIIINYIGASEVVKYNVAFNLFSMMNIAFSTIAAPYWAAYANAWFQKDIEWIKIAQKKLRLIWTTVVIISLVVLMLSDYIYLLWVGKRVSIPFELSFYVFIYMALFTFGMIYNTFINSTGKILLQTVSLTILTLMYIPLVLFFINYVKFGLNSIPLALSIVALYTVFVAPLQSKKLILGTAKGIYNK